MEAAVLDHNRVGINSGVHNSLDDDLVAYRPNEAIPTINRRCPGRTRFAPLAYLRAEPGAHPRNPRIAAIPIHQFTQARVYPGKMT
jgi:hypothetical protein